MKTKLISLLAVLASIATCSSLQASSYVPDQWERQIIAACLILEASNQGEQGMIAVANVMRNRADGVSAKIYREIKKPYAFSALNSATTGKTGNRGYAGHVTKASRDHNWRLALQIVDRMFAGTLQDITNGATHYTVVNKHTGWMNRMELTAVIGNHKFLRRG